MIMSRKKIIILIAITLFLAIIIGISIPMYNFYQAYQVMIEPPPEETDSPDPAPEPVKLLTEPSYNILVYGIDGGEWVNDTYRPGAARADTIIMLQVHLENKTASILSIPRDTLVTIPDRGEDKINHAHAFGGAPLLIETVEQFTNIPIDYYIQVNYKLFKEAVDTMGGVAFDLDRKIGNLEPGLQMLNGDEAFTVISFRRERMGDIGRVERQQQFLAAVAREIRTSQPKQLVYVTYASWRHVKSNISIQESAELITEMRSIKEENITKAIIPGWFYDRKGVSYWRPDQEETNTLLEDLFTVSAPTL
jgi:LCP family protein required for cell wall assembly